MKCTDVPYVHLLLVVLVAVLLSSCGAAAPPPDTTESIEAPAAEAPAATGAEVFGPLDGGAAAPAPTLAATAESSDQSLAYDPRGETSGTDAEEGAAMEEAPAEDAAPLPTSDLAMQGGPAPLKAGEVDDNAQFEGYLQYLANNDWNAPRRADVSERYFIMVRNENQAPLYDVRVLVYDEQGNRVFEGLTYAGGQTLFLPRVIEVADNIERFRVVAQRGDSTAEAMVQRGAGERVELTLTNVNRPDELRLDLLFLLDTTGSMADELRRIQDTIDTIAQRIDAFEPRPVLRFGLVAYRDVGDAYVTRRYDFTTDVTSFREKLNQLSADGGGDEPEALEEALHETVSSLEWSDDAIRLAFLVADAEPQVNRQLGYTYLSDAQTAVARGIKIYPIAASNTGERAEYVFRQLAQQTMGRFIFLTYQPGQSSGAPGETTDLQAGEQEYTVERLDDLIVQVVERELAAAVGAS